MALSVDEIRSANKQYYYTNYFSKAGRAKWIICSISMIVLLQGITCFIAYIAAQKKCYRRASLEIINNREVYDWVAQEMRGFWRSIPFIIIVISTVLMIVVSLVAHFMVNFKIYMLKGLFTRVTLFVVILEMIAMFWLGKSTLVSDIKDNRWMIFLYVIKIIIGILSSGIGLPVEMKTPVRSIGNIMNKIIDRGLKHL